MTRAGIVVLVAGFTSVYAACGAPPDDAATAAEIETAVTAQPPSPAPPPVALPTAAAEAPPTGPRGCIRGGSTPAEVRAAMGEPDSIVGGWWIYGRTQILFGYGTVLDFVNGGNLVTC